MKNIKMLIVLLMFAILTVGIWCSISRLSVNVDKPEAENTISEEQQEKQIENVKVSVVEEMTDKYATQIEESNKEQEKEQEKQEKSQETEQSGKSPVPEPVKDNQIADEGLTCTLSIRCDTILENISLLKEEKRDIVPQDGIILNERKVKFFEGDSVFDVLLRETQNNKIHFEYIDTPMYNSAYIEGIANIYEFDCGSLSGWIYHVNGQNPKTGCSQYILEQGDRIEWIYTCDLGNDS